MIVLQENQDFLKQGQRHSLLLERMAFCVTPKRKLRLCW